VMSALLGGGGLGHPTKRMDGSSARFHQPVRCCFSLNLPATQEPLKVRTAQDNTNTTTSSSCRTSHCTSRS